MAVASEEKNKTLLTPAQKRKLREVFETDPENRYWPDVLHYDGKGRNPTFRILARLGLVEYSHLFGNSFRAALTTKGILYLHGEEI